MVFPGDFIPSAEETGLIVPIGEWVLRRACAQKRQWHDDGHFPDVRIAVNLSARQFKQQDIVSVSPAATLTLSADGTSLMGVVAGEPVEVRQKERVANGTRLTYNPASQSMVLVGEVVLKDAGREVHGKALTFHLGDDRILVDGREQGRIETVLPKEPPKP